MSKGFDQTDRSIVQSVKKLTGLQKILRKFPDNPQGRKKMLKEWRKYHKGFMGELDRIAATQEDLDRTPEALEAISETVDTDGVDVTQPPTQEVVDYVHKNLGK